MRIEDALAFSLVALAAFASLTTPAPLAFAGAVLLPCIVAAAVAARNA